MYNVHVLLESRSSLIGLEYKLSKAFLRLYFNKMHLSDIFRYNDQLECCYQVFKYKYYVLRVVQCTCIPPKRDNWDYLKRNIPIHILHILRCPNFSTIICENIESLLHFRMFHFFYTFNFPVEILNEKPPLGAHDPHMSLKHYVFLLSMS